MVSVAGPFPAAVQLATALSPHPAAVAVRGYPSARGLASLLIPLPSAVIPCIPDHSLWVPALVPYCSAGTAAALTRYGRTWAS